MPKDIPISSELSKQVVAETSEAEKIEKKENSAEAEPKISNFIPVRRHTSEISLILDDDKKV